MANIPSKQLHRSGTLEDLQANLSNREIGFCTTDRLAYYKLNGILFPMGSGIIPDPTENALFMAYDDPEHPGEYIYGWKQLTEMSAPYDTNIKLWSRIAGKGLYAESAKNDIRGRGIADALDRIENPDVTPIEDSDNLISSGAVYGAIIGKANATGITPGIYTKVSVNNEGGVVEGGSLEASDIPEINTILRLEDSGGFVQGNITPQGGENIISNRCRGRFVFVNGAKTLHIHQSVATKTRVTFFANNSLGPQNLVDTPSNQFWTSGDFNVSVPSRACFYVVSCAYTDDADILPENVKTQVSLDTFDKSEYILFVPLITGSFSASITRAVSERKKVEQTDKYVCVRIGAGFKYRVVFYSSLTSSSSQYIKTETSDSWQTKSSATPIPYNAACYYVSVAKTDDSDINLDELDIDYFVDDNPFFGKTISILGDSISTFGGSVSDPDNSRFAVEGDPTYPGNRCRYPQSNLVTDVNNTYWMKLINSLGLVLGINDSWAGSMVSNTSATDMGDVGPNRCISSMTRIGHLDDNGTPDIILVNAGTNDIGGNVTLGTFSYDDPSSYTDEQVAALDVSTFANAYRAMLIRLQKTYKSARIIVMLPNYTTSYYNSQKEDQYCEVVKEACDYFGVPYVDMRTAGITMFNRSSYLPDGIHYNAAGMSKIYEKIKLGFEENL